jgi:hypothetical protein
MTRAEFVTGSAVFLAVVVAGTVSVKRVDRHFAHQSAATPSTPSVAPSTSSVACVGEDGSWKNWVWANVPTLSPKCAGDR